LQPDWSTQAGRALAALAKAIRDKGIVLTVPITVFGSGPLQMCVEPKLLSADVDISVAGHLDVIKNLVDEIGLGKGTSRFYIEVVPSYVFRPGVNWMGRATEVEFEGVKFIFPDALDILLAKLRRLETKDIQAFRVVQAKTGRPTEQEIITELRACYDMFYFQKNAEKSVLWEKTEKLWPIYSAKKLISAQLF
jgi:hypothetical protein